MKYTYFLLPIILLAFFYGPVSASCGTCAPQPTCADGVCGPTESSHEHQKGHDH